MQYEVRGKVKQVGELVTYGSEGKKKELWIETPGEYPQTISVEAHGDTVGKLDDYNNGDDVRVEFWLNGREWTNKEGVKKVFNSLRLKWIETDKGEGQAFTPDHIENGPAESDDDLPF